MTASPTTTAISDAATTAATTARPPSRQERWRARHPLAAWAHAATRSAIRRGLLHRRPCAGCGAPDTEAHHPDYRRPLAVVWYCRACHRRHHHGRLDRPGAGDLFADGAL